MATCKDCIHFEACKSCWCSFWENKEMTENDRCKMFKDKSCVIEVPCPIGTKIYMLVTKRPKLTYPEFTFIKESKLTYNNLERVLEDFGKTVFLNREEAEKSLKERENNG